MILIGQYDLPFTRRVAITLHTYRMPFERQPYSVFSNIGLVRLHNPLVRVPVLVIEQDGSKEMLIDFKRNHRLSRRDGRTQIPRHDS